MPVLDFNLSVKPCNKAEIHFRCVASHQSDECLLEDQMEQREGNNSDSAEGLKQPLIKYTPPQAAAAIFFFFLRLWCKHEYLPRFVTLFISDSLWGLLLGDASGMWSMHLEDNTFERGAPDVQKKIEDPRRRLAGKSGTEMSNHLWLLSLSLESVETVEYSFKTH